MCVRYAESIMTERSRPYIGVSGVASVSQQRHLLDYFTHEGLDQHRELALGVKATHKTQFLDQENKYGREWYPVGPEGFSAPLEPHADTLRVAQIYLDTDYVDDAVYRNEFMDRIRRRGAVWLNAVQFDMLPWHKDASLLHFVEQIKCETDFNMLIQVHSDAMQALGPDKIARKLGEYGHVLDYVLFDASHGKGVRLDTHALQPFLEAAHTSDELSATGISVAGGLNARVVREDLPHLIQQYPDLSWDAEGQLHHVDVNGKRPLDMETTKDYLTASSEVLRSV
jgi:hypothetical protein